MIQGKAFLIIVYVGDRNEEFNTRLREGVCRVWDKVMQERKTSRALSLSRTVGKLESVIVIPSPGLVQWDAQSDKAISSIKT